MNTLGPKPTNRISPQYFSGHRTLGGQLLKVINTCYVIIATYIAIHTDIAIHIVLRQSPVCVRDQLIAKHF